jgi:hypothetical protein
MAQTRKRRRRKHRGTQGGRIDRRGARGRPRSRDEARAQARRRAESRRDLPPTWRGAFNRAAIGGAIFFVLAIALLKQPIGGAVALSLVMVAMYVPLGYYVERFIYQRRLAKARAARADR